jgi:ATP-dependent Clp protease ATP-binding subunit ClpC
MFERFSDHCRKAMAHANHESVRLNHQYIDPGHILLGLIKEGNGTGANVLRKLNVDLPALALDVEKLLKRDPDMAGTGKLQQTAMAKKVMECAIEEARLANQRYVGTEHLLLGLLGVSDGIAATVLTGRGLTLTQVRQATLELLAGGPAAAGPESAAAILAASLQEVRDAWPNLSPENRDAILAIVRNSRRQSN